MTFRASECIKKRSGAEDPNNWLSNIQRCKQGRSFSHGLRSIGETIRHKSRPCNGKVMAPKERTYNSPFRTIGWTNGYIPSTKHQRSPGKFSCENCLWLAGYLSNTALDPWKQKCKQLVRNWVRNIQVKQINCRHVPTEENPRDSQMCGVGEEMLTDWELFGGRDQAGYHNHRTGHQTL